MLQSCYNVRWEGGGRAINCSKGELGGQYHRALALAGKQVLEITRPVRVTPLSLFRQRICSLITYMTVYMLP